MSTNPVLSLAKTYEEEWASPEMDVLTGYQEQPPAFPLHIFRTLEAWVRNAAELKSAPVDYVAGSLLCVAAGLIGNALCVSPWEGWKEAIVLWVANIGLPSSNKSPALDAVLESVVDLEAQMQRGYLDEIKDYETNLEVAKAEREAWEKDLRDAIKRNEAQPPKPEKAYEPEYPASPRIRVADATIEALSAVLIENPRGVINIQDELSGWLENQNRYAGSGTDRPFWLQVFGGRPHTVDRVKNKGKHGYIPRLSISICGGIQPDVLEKGMMNGPDDGLSGRFLYIWPNPVPPRRPTGREDRATIDHVVRRLHSIPTETNESGEIRPRVIKLSADAADAFQTFRVELADVEHTAQGLLLSHIGKLPGITLRLALVLEMLWWAHSSEVSYPAEVSIDAIRAACGLVESYFLPMASRTFGSAALPQSERLATGLAKWIYKERPGKVNAQHIRRHRIAGLKTSDMVSSAVSELEEAAWLLPKPTRAGDKPGRQKSDYLVNPLIWEDSK